MNNRNTQNTPIFSISPTINPYPMLKDNKQYQELRVKEGTFIPDAGIEYPDDPTVRMINPPKTHPFDIDENYPYYDESFHFRLNRWLAYLATFQPEQ